MENFKKERVTEKRAKYINSGTPNYVVIYSFE